MRQSICLSCLVALFLAAPSIHALKLYKVTLPDGTVVYQDNPPEAGSTGQIEEKDIDPNANVVPIEQFPLDGEYTIPSDTIGTIQPGTQTTTRVKPISGDKLDPAALATAGSAPDDLSANPGSTIPSNTSPSERTNRGL